MVNSKETFAFIPKYTYFRVSTAVWFIILKMTKYVVHMYDAGWINWGQFSENYTRMCQNRKKAKQCSMFLWVYIKTAQYDEYQAYKHKKLLEIRMVMNQEIKSGRLTWEASAKSIMAYFFKEWGIYVENVKI